MGLNSLAQLFNFVVCNPCQSSPSLTILVPLWFIIISLVFFHLCKALFSGFLQFKGKFDDGQNTSKYNDRAPLNQTMVTSLVDLFLVRRSGSRWKIDRHSVSCRAIWSIMLASFFSVGENSTCSLDKGKKTINKSQNPLNITQKAIFYWLFTII